jgi:hypothetical protein
MKASAGKGMDLVRDSVEQMQGKRHLRLRSVSPYGWGGDCSLEDLTNLVSEVIYLERATKLENEMAKKNEEPTERIQVIVAKRVADRLDELAKRLGWSRNQVAEWLLDLEVSDLEWVLNKFAARLRGAIRKGG